MIIIAWTITEETMISAIIAVSGLLEYCTIFHFPPSVRPYVTCVTSQLFLII